MSSLAPPPVAHPPTFRVERAWVAPVTVGALALAGTLVLAVVDPTTTRVPLCPLHALTGLDCPLCGSLRAVHSLTSADLGAALDHNVLFTTAVPALVLCWAVWLTRSFGRPFVPALRLPARAGVALVCIMVAFGVARNLPALGWLAAGA